MRTRLPSALLVTALACSVFAVSAQAQSPRTFVSAAGSDSNPCSFAAPCRHFQAAVNATSPGGEVDALDPAGYGPITITQAITIEGQGWSYIAPPSGGNGITINAVSGDVTIHGVSLNGAGITGGTNGIVFNSGSSLTVTDCVVQNFVIVGGDANTGNGILIKPTSGTMDFTITNTIASHNGTSGISYFPPGTSVVSATNGVIDHVVTNTNGLAGILVFSTSGFGAVAVTISNSVVSNCTSASSNAGIDIEDIGTTILVSIDNVTASGNQTGIAGRGPATVLLGRSVITGNQYGVENSTSNNTFYTYKDNRISANTSGTDIRFSPLNGTVALQ